MLVDDSVVVRSIFARVLGDREGIEIVCEASDAESAVNYLADVTVDIILLDIEMPMRSGLDALPDIRAKAQGAPILVVSAFAEENGPAAVQALSLGACDTLAKPGRAGFSGRFSEILVEKVVRLARSAREPIESRFAVPPALDYVVKASPRCIAIGSSTGGIPAIHHILRNLDPALECPIFITQHLPPAFMTFFSRQLGGMTHRRVKVAEVGERVKSNHVYVAPGNAHLICRAERDDIIIDHQLSYSGSLYCPSVDAMLESVAKTYGRDALAIILSGMGNDGVAGARAFKAHSAPVLVQDMASSVVWGMPGAVAREGLASAILPPEQISHVLARVATAL
jgi:two-component system chemotaxis response regulator CheB